MKKVNMIIAASLAVLFTVTTTEINSKKGLIGNSRTAEVCIGNS